MATFRLAMACTFLLCVASATHAQDAIEAPYTLKQVGPNTWAAISNNNAKAPAGGNAGFVIGDDGVAVIDSFASADAAKQLLADIRKLTKLPVKFVINTHYHLDHVAGNAVFIDAGAVALAHRHVRGWIHSENLKFFGRRSSPSKRPSSSRLRHPRSCMTKPSISTSDLARFRCAVFPGIRAATRWC
jgi:cyclase